MTQKITPPSLPSEWAANNAMANFIGMGLLHTLIAHGFTGEHGKALTMPQFIMHTVSLWVFCTILLFFQHRALKLKGITNRFAHLPLFMVAVPLVFWAGYYLFYIPYDILLMYTTIGLLNGLCLRKHYSVTVRTSFV